ncbi:toll-like receptor 2 isoform X1 [Podarcis lilfordi]|uniref:Toll-like receptor 2 n=1 Tax=Podarcis lilfordi TaxID=74358 RepID=A0AA35KV84_9SAUR|nr:toll-like receptor 2 isoform X1 [Podarcis lilfordi]
MAGCSPAALLPFWLCPRPRRRSKPSEALPLREIQSRRGGGGSRERGRRRLQLLRDDADFAHLRSPNPLEETLHALPAVMFEQVWCLWFISAVGAVSLSAQQISPFCDATHFCNYSSRALRAVPSGLEDDIVKLDLTSNSIEHIGEEDLKFAINLKTLLLQSNQIRTIDGKAFRSLVKLEYLDLSKNKLSHLSPSWFRPLSSLQKLNLIGNFYQLLGEAPLFSELPKLRYLYFGNGNFSALQAHDMEGISTLEELEIEGHNLKQYVAGTLKSIKLINHIMLNIPPDATLAAIIYDVTDSVVCLELRNIQILDMPPIPYSDPVLLTAVQKVILRNVELSDMSVIQIAPIFARMKQMQEVEIVDCRFEGTGQFYGLQDAPTSLQVITVRNLTITKFYSFSDLSSVTPLVTNLTRLTLENAFVYLVPCDLARHFYSLLYLDFSGNLLLDPYLKKSLCADAWPRLQTLNVSRNSLKQISVVAESVALRRHLINLDISQNNFEAMPASCVWPRSLKFLNISGCKLNMLTNCIPRSLEVLDVSHNNLKDFRLSLPDLQELYIKDNRLTTLPDAASIPSARIINIRRNQIFDFNEQQLVKFAKIEKLDARYNSFRCSCEFVSFTQSQQGPSNVFVAWPENYICDSPEHVRGKQVGAVQFRPSDCHLTLMVSLICILMLLVVVAAAVLCHKLHAIWYMQMTWAWLQAKRKPQRNHKKETCYDAFVSYSEQDSEWVENVMVQELEQANPPFKLCLHKRDFTPGKWIVDNIIDSIEKSSKTLFVLSEHFVQSEWCRYELDFSHFRLFDENNDAAILILLEPIPEKTIPKRFCKLRKLMNTKTYLEWPRDEVQQQIFWFNLKTAIKS